MKADILALWVAALRSGEFAQGFHALRARAKDGTYCYCPLGVLCELHRRAGHGWRWDEDECCGICQYGNGGGEENSACLPPAVMEWAGLRNPDPTFLRYPPPNGPSWRTSTVALNDTAHLPLEEIGAALERATADGIT